ncbi:hypothetical protein [Hymenobacter persicinus]|uniref:Uncharacterized protein n=1 Tax=Hymenobacter persicinus TaxID=2025506 RepID=A0A4V1ZAB5_9BACT|nr:hypothetical protein [Hymenobacter persicinus]RYU76728.1 hypothetical protein EWM57_18205 [Hymenobacter persicinus]
MAYTSEQLVILAAIAPVGAASAVAGYRFRHLPVAGRLLAALVWCALATEIVSRIFWVYKINNLFLWPIYMTLELGLLVRLYTLEANKTIRRAAAGGIVLFAAGAVLELLWRAHQPLAIDNVARVLESVVIILLALTYCYRQFREPATASLLRLPLFWASVGLLVFFSATFFIYLFINFALNYSQGLNYQIWIIHAGVNSLLYAAYAYALWISPAK